MPPEWAMVRAVVASTSRARIDAGRIHDPFRKPTGQKRRSMGASRLPGRTDSPRARRTKLVEHPPILSTRPPRPARPLNGTDAIVVPCASSSCQNDSFDTSSRRPGRSRA